MRNVAVGIAALIIGINNLNASELDVHRQIRWKASLQEQPEKQENRLREVIYFDGAVYEEGTELPIYSENFDIDIKDEGLSAQEYKAELKEAIFEEISDKEIRNISDTIKIKDEIEIISSGVYIRKKAYLNIRFVPIIRNKYTGRYEKLTAFQLRITNYESQKEIPNTNFRIANKIQNTKKQLLSKSGGKAYAEHSVLSKGTWYRMAVTNTGIHKISYSELANAGINIKTINPKNIRIYGNGGGMLPESNSAARYDDLQENAIKVTGEEDGKFDEGDYILFYARGPNTWAYDSTDNRFHHKTNLYSDAAYYYINTDTGPGKRIQVAESTTEEANRHITRFTDYAYHEKDSLNFLKSGRQWYGEVFDILTSYSFSLNFPDLAVDSLVYLRTSLLAASTIPSYFKIYSPGNQTYSVKISNIPSVTNGDYAIVSVNTFLLTPSSTKVSLLFTYNKPTTTSKGWLDYFELNVIRNLRFSGGQVSFRSPESAGTGNISEFTMGNANSNIKVWDVTDIINPVMIESIYEAGSSELSFKTATDNLKEFTAYDGSSFYTPKITGRIENQDLHGTGQVDMVIVTHPDFYEQAEKLAEMHRTNDSLTVLLVTPNLIYNEFSSGAQDITAIRDFMKMLYDRASSEKDIPKYLLLFGTASYDYKGRIKPNTNFVPTYESVNSLVPTSSYLTDDYFGLLDESEGLYCNGNLDIGIGRFPVRTLQHAKDAVEKIERYASKKNLAPGNKDPETGRNAISNYADWRNWICFIGDDKDNNLHLTQADMLATKVDTSNRQYDVDKIYFDAYKEYSTPGGQRYPDVTAAINQRVEKGALIVNYTGHGGEVGWSHERVLEISDINKWGNKYNMPVFTTATCEFSRLDDPERISAGELVFLNPNGGGIALFTTTRLSFANSNFALNDSFYNYVFKKKNGKYPKMGDIIRQSKVANGSNQYIRNFVLLGDPAMELAYPEYNVVTTEINGKKVTEGKPDTLKALTEIKIKGMIADDNGNKLPGFTGIVYPGIYDKAVSITTLGNDAESLPVRTFTLQKNIIYKGMARVSKGEFEFSFIVPKDIAYKYGKGKISYYAAGTIDSTAKEYTDANGCYEGIIIGGSGDTASADTKGPQIKLYMDNTSFVSGGRTGTNPLLLAYIKDESGINTTGNGIGHDITAVLDNNTENTIVLNDYYETDADKYTSGKINYYFSDLSAGKHTLRLKVWDVYNNSSEAGITFYVENSYKIFCYPNPLVYYSGVKQTTNLCFEHNYSLKDVNVRLKIEVSDMLGRKVKSIDKTVSDGVEYEQNVYRSVYEWDGLDDNNERLKPGIYLFRLTATNSSGLNASGGGKIRIKY